MERTRKFTDLDLNFIANPATGDVSVKYDDNAIKQAIKNLVLTLNYERPFHPEIGSQVRKLLFEPMTPISRIILQKAIENTIVNFEPRAQLKSVDVQYDDDNNEVLVSIVFTIINTTAPIFLDFTLKRTR